MKGISDGFLRRHGGYDMLHDYRHTDCGRPHPPVAPRGDVVHPTVIHLFPRLQATYQGIHTPSLLVMIPSWRYCWFSGRLSKPTNGTTSSQLDEPLT